MTVVNVSKESKKFFVGLKASEEKSRIRIRNLVARIHESGTVPI